MKEIWIASVISAGLCCISSSVQASDTISLSHQKAAPVLDGAIDELEWSLATKVSLDVEQHPSRGAPAKVKTIGYIYEDGKSLHIALQAFDLDPENLRANLHDRDGAWDDDLLGVTLDTFNDERGGYEFYLNPLGVQIDARMKDDDGWETNDAWNAIWEGASLITETGWQVEISIPLKALRFPKTQGKQIWGIALYRAYQGDVLQWISDAKADTSIECSLCQFTKFEGFDSVASGRNLQLTPTLTFGRSDSREVAPGPWQEGEFESEAGVDIRWGITESSVLNATINPDFSQVEADEAELEINAAHSLFLDEKRPFFLDGAEYFNTDFLNLVHTRNIADPDVGIKVTGKTGNHSYGVMVADDNSTSFLLPGNQGSKVATLEGAAAKSKVAIARYKVDVGERSNIGALVTTRSNGVYKNAVISIDGKAWLSSVDSIEYQAVKSESENPLALQNPYNLAPEESGNAFSIEYKRDTYDYFLFTKYENISENFRADMGFVDKKDFEKINIGGMLKFYGTKDEWIKRSSYKLSANSSRDQSGKKLVDETKIRLILEGIYQSKIELKIYDKERFYAKDGSSVGQYFDINKAKIYSHFKPIPNVRLELEANVGKEIDYVNENLGDLTDYRFGVDLNLGKHLKINVSQNYKALDVGANSINYDDKLVNFNEGRLYSANQTDFRVNYQFNIKSKLKFVLQYTDIKRDTKLYQDNFDTDFENDVSSKEKYFSTQLIYSYKLNAQSLFYLGYSDNGYEPEQQHELSRSNRSVFAKISYAWQ